MANQLKGANSLYLRQHADDPVHWLEYNDENIQIAKNRNRPILLSIGYSSCHWCHAMKDETFMDKEIANFINTNFTPFKIDKEEHPEIDQYYQSACQLFTGQGGWPLNALVDTEFKPFFVGTYFPKNTANNVPGFSNILGDLLDIWKKDKDSLLQNATEVVEKIKSKNDLPKEDKIEYPGHFPHPGSIFHAVRNFKDNEFGGYGEAPKFPNFSLYEYACEQMLENNIEDEDAKHLIKTFEFMLSSGLIDQVRGGIHRYSVTKDWRIPHFEKLLIDQAGFLKTLSKLSLYYPTPVVYDHIANTLDYLRSEMLSDDNTFFSSQDADSEGVEGLYFTYTFQEVEDLLAKLNTDEKLTQDKDFWMKSLSVTKEGNFEQGLNIITLPGEKIRDFFNKDVWSDWRNIRSALLQERKQRIPPATDNKGIASWNFQLISALCDVYQYCQIRELKIMAANLFKQTLGPILEQFCIKETEGKTKIIHSTTNSSKRDNLEDYVSFAECMLRSYEVTGNENFKANFKNVMMLIKNDFMKDGELYNLNLSTNNDSIYAQKVQTWDQGEKSPYASFINLYRRGKMFLKENISSEFLAQATDDLIQFTLRNPLAHGEALRALTYPQNVYRNLKCPKKWADDDKFLSQIHFFMPRFILSFENLSDDKWEICNENSCELNGEGLEELFNILAPKVESKNDS